MLRAISMMEIADTASERPVVLVVDDDPAVCSALKFYLELEGFSVLTYPDGPSVLGSSEAAQAKCLVIDYKLRGMNGMELLHELRIRHITTPAILITSHPNAALNRLAARAGIPIVEKPLLGDALSQSVQHACRS